MPTASDVWYAALRIIADFSPMTYWRMSNDAEFWWTLTSRAQLLGDRFAEEPFTYADIVLVWVISEVRFRQEVFSCDWPALHRGLLSVKGLLVEETRDFRIPPVSPPNHALRLSVGA